MGLGDGLHDGIPVQGHQSPQIQDLHVDALRLQGLGGLQGEVDLTAPGDDGQVPARPLHVRRTQGDGVLPIGDLLLVGVQQLVFQEHYRVVVPDSGLQQALGVGSGAGGHHLQSREVAEEILQALGMLACVPATGAHGRPQDHGDAALSAGHVADLGSLVEQGIRALRGEVVVHQLHHGPQPPHRGAHGHAHKPLLGDGSVNDAVGAELLQKALGDGEHIAHDGHVLAHDENLFVPEHFLVQGFTDGLADGDLLAHLATHLSLSVTYISSSTVAGSGYGDASANFTASSISASASCRMASSSSWVW